MSGFRNYGPNVSENPIATTSGGQFSSEDRAYESVITQADSPVIDWEMNLRSDVLGDQGLRLSTQKRNPSCFINADFLERSDLTGSFTFPIASVGNENKFTLLPQDTIINGWGVKIDYTNSVISGSNVITLSAPPVSGTRTDLVILEAWRALILPAPSPLNKSPTSLICRLGNVKAPDAVNLADDLIDPIYGQSSNARIQIQYRLRVIQGINILSFPDGIDDSGVIANTVSNFAGPGADGSPSGQNYSRSPDDSGLWVAGTNTSASASLFGTVDGLMYAVPVCAIVRRNTTAFNRTTNLNGASLIASGTSTRPDGLFADQITADDVIDLRRGALWDMRDLLNKSVQQVFANEMTTSVEISSLGTGGTSFLFRNNIGLSGQMGNPDRVRRYFSDRIVMEPIVARVDVVGSVTSVNFDLSNLRVNWESSSINMLGLATSAIYIHSINMVRIITPGSNSDIDAMDNNRISSIVLSMNIGPGIDRATINFSSSVSNCQIHAALNIVYPGRTGLARNVIAPIQFWTPSAANIATWVDSTILTATSDVDRFKLNSSMWHVDPGHRELFVNLKTIAQTNTFYVPGGSSPINNIIYIPEILTNDPVTITDGINAPYTTTNFIRYGSYTAVILSGAVSCPPGTAVSVNYKTLRPLPAVTAPPGDSYQMFYKSRAIQSILPPSGTQTLRLVPRTDPDSIYSIGVGSGSLDNASPYTAPSAQIPVGALPAVGFPESLLDGYGVYPIAGYTATGGFVRLSSIIPYVPNPGLVTLFKGGTNTVIDADGRFFWPLADNGSPSNYPPSVEGQPLLFGRRHKTAVPILMELKDDFLSIGRKGTLVLVIFTSWSDFDPANKMAMASTLTFSAAGVYRTRGRMLNRRRPDY